MNKNNKQYYECGECGLKYEDKAMSKKCEAWCKETKSCNRLTQECSDWLKVAVPIWCNLDIIKHAIK